MKLSSLKPNNRDIVMMCLGGIVGLLFDGQFYTPFGLGLSALLLGIMGMAMFGFNWRGLFRALLLDLFFAIFVTSTDPSVTMCHSYGNCPYGFLWSVLNPFYWTNIPYRIVIASILAGAIGLQLWLVKKGKLNRWAMMPFLLITAGGILLGGGYANVTEFMLSPLMTINPLVGIFYFFQFYPFWSLVPNLTDPHYLCALGSCGYVTIGHGSGFWLVNLKLPATWAHFSFMLAFVSPIIAWFMRRRNESWNADKYWKIITIMMFALIVASEVVLLTWGCCNGWTFTVNY